MPMKTGDEYLASLGSLNLKAHIRGQKTGPDDHDLVKLSRQAVALIIVHNKQFFKRKKAV